MKKPLYMFYLILSFCGLSLAVNQDVKRSKDPSLLSRMPDFYISEYKDINFDSHKFIDKNAKQFTVEGNKTYLEYRLNTGAAEPGELKIRRNIQDALKKIGAAVIFDDNFNKVSTIMLHSGNKETWVEVRTYNNMYRLTIVEKEVMEQVVVANAEIMKSEKPSSRIG